MYVQKYLVLHAKLCTVWVFCVYRFGGCTLSHRNTPNMVNIHQNIVVYLRKRSPLAFNSFGGIANSFHYAFMLTPPFNLDLCTDHHAYTVQNQHVPAQENQEIRNR